MTAPILYCKAWQASLPQKQEKNKNARGVWFSSFSINCARLAIVRDWQLCAIGSQGLASHPVARRLMLKSSARQIKA